VAEQCSASQARHAPPRGRVPHKDVPELRSASQTHLARQEDEPASGGSRVPRARSAKKRRPATGLVNAANGRTMTRPGHPVRPPAAVGLTAKGDGLPPNGNDKRRATRMAIVNSSSKVRRKKNIQRT